MSTSKYVDRICVAAASLMLVITILFMSGEKLGITVIHREEGENTSAMFTENDLNADWDVSGATEIVLNGDFAKITGTGAYFSNHTLHIVYAGRYVIRGMLDGSVQIEADGDDKIWLLFDSVDITSETAPPLYIKQAGKVFLTLKENSRNTLTFENSDEGSEIDGSIFSRDDLTINGKGELNVVSSNHHGVVCNDCLVFTGGNINITAKVDGVHAHDAIKICNTDIAVSAGDDGLHAGNDDESAIFYLESGHISITECYEGIEANEITIAGGTVDIVSTDDGINASGRGKTSLITVSGGDITIINPNGRDADGIDSNGSINITGGNLFISVNGNGTNNAIDYGSENGGKFTISGGTIIACGSSQMAEAPDSASAQGFIMQMVLGDENEIVSLLDSSGKEIISKEIPCSFSSVIISSPELSVGDSVKLKIGETETDITVSNVAENEMGGFGNIGGFAPGGENRQGEQNSFGRDGGNNPPERPGGDLQNNGMPGGQGGVPPEMPDSDRREMQGPGGNRQADNGRDAFELPENDGQNRNFDFSGSSNWGNDQRFVPDFMMDNFDGQTPMRGEESDGKNGYSNSTWIWLGASALILVSGIYIAVRKRY